MPPNTQDDDFKIHVDESCLSAPMEDDNQSSVSNKENNVPSQEKPVSTEAEEASETVQEDVQTDDIKTDEVLETELEEVIDAQPGDEVADSRLEEDVTAPEPEEEHSAPKSEEVATELGEEPNEDREPQELQEKNDVSEEPSEPEKLATPSEDNPVESDTTINAEPSAGEEEAAQALDAGLVDEEDDNTLQPTMTLDDDANQVEVEENAEEEGCGLTRKASIRTEALIRDAAMAVMARIEERDRPVSSIEQEDEGDQSILSRASEDPDGPDEAEPSHDGASEYSRRDSGGSQLLDAPSIHSSEGLSGEGGSSHHESDGDVFSDRSGRSARSSLGSFESGADESRRKSTETIQRNDEVHYRRSPRVSGVSEISDISRYDREEFIPTARATPRPAFRTPSDVRAIQMSSPAPSIYSPSRSGRRHTGHSSSGFPTVSRLGSPTVSAQYSPKGRSTPPRFKAAKKEAPLVLLHVTMLPLRWIWGGVINGLDHIKGLEHYEPSESMKNLRDAWRQLQDRAGDTVLERGILLPHPQNDYEVLEERLLEALELPLRRRARILECGHYLGPSNVMANSNEDDVDSDDEYASQSGQKQTDKHHWCGTCRNEIRYEELGEGRIFRVKVFASNGLMKAGAWEACWREMERIDVELEPLVDNELQGEIEKLASLQLEIEEQHEREMAMEVAQHEAPYVDHAPDHDSPPPLHASPIEPPTASTTAAVTADHDAVRRQRDEERLREIYGHTPPPPEQHETASSMPPHPDSYSPPPSPPSPSEQAYERRETRRRSFQGASLPELMLESVKVLLQDRKNIAIIVLSVLIMMLVVRNAPTQGGTAAEKEAEVLRGLYSRQHYHHHQQEHEAVPQVADETPSPQSVLDNILTSVAVASSSLLTASVPFASSEIIPSLDSEARDLASEAPSMAAEASSMYTEASSMASEASDISSEIPTTSSAVSSTTSDTSSAFSETSTVSGEAAAISSEISTDSIETSSTSPSIAEISESRSVTTPTETIDPSPATEQPSETSSEVDPCLSRSARGAYSQAAQPERESAERSVIRVYETVTETIRVTATESRSSKSTSVAAQPTTETVTETLRVTLTESIAPEETIFDAEVDDEEMTAAPSAIDDEPFVGQETSAAVPLEDEVESKPVVDTHEEL